MKNKFMDELIQIPITLKIKGSGEIEIVSIKTPKMFFKEPFFIDSLINNFGFSKSQVKLPAEDEQLSRPAHYNESDDRVVYDRLDDFIKKYNADI